MRGKKGGYGRTHSEVSVPSVKKKSSFVDLRKSLRFLTFFSLFFRGMVLWRHDGWLDRKREREEERERRRERGRDG